MPDPIDIKSLSGAEKFIAQKSDILNHNQKIEGDEVSIFNAAIKEYEKSGKQRFSVLGTVYERVGETFKIVRSFFQRDDKESLLTEGLPNDATRVETLVPPEILNITKDENKAPVKINTKFTANTSVSWDESQAPDEKTFEKALESLIPPNSKLKGQAKYFIEKSKKYGINPFFLVSIAMHESARGNSSAAQNHNNVGGINDTIQARKLHRKFFARDFSSVDDCIEIMAKTVAKRQSEQYTTVGKVAFSGRYCGKSEGHGWQKAVLSFMESLRTKYNSFT